MDWPLTGRDEELAAITGTLDRGGSVVLAGAAGVGKSRLAEEALNGLTASVARVTATDASASIPFGAFAHLLGELEAPDADRPDADRGTEHLQLLQQARAAVLARADGGPLTLGIDDAHLLDDASATLTRQLAATGRVRVLATVRTGEQSPVRALWKDGPARRVDLGRLTRAEADRLLEAGLDGRVAEATRDELWRLTRGNPLFLTELVLGALDRGDLVREGDRWHLDGTVPTPSLRLAELVEGRLARLDDRERDAVEALAVGGPLGTDLLVELVGERPVEALERARLVRPVDPQSDRRERRGVMRLAHPVHGEVLRERMPTVRRRRIAGRLADLLEAAGARRDGDVLRLATWRLESDGHADPELLTRAARRSLGRFDLDLAVRLARAATAAAPGDFEAALTLGQALARGDDPEAALQQLARARELADDDGQRARAALATARCRFFRAYDPDGARRVVEAAEVADPDWADELHAMDALFASLRGDLPRAAAAGARIRGRTDAGDRAVRATLSVAAFSEVLLGRFGDAEASIEAGRAACAGGDYLAGDLFGAFGAMLTAYRGEVRAAREHARAGFERAVDDRPDVAGPWGDVLCHTLILRGRPAAAARVGERTMALVAERDPFAVGGMTLGGWAYAAALRRDHDTVEDLLARLDGLATIGDPRPGIFANLARARMRAAHGDVAGAAALAARSGQRAVDDGHVVWGSFLLHEPVRLGRPGQVAGPLAAAVRGVGGRLLPVMARHAAALDAGDATALEEVAHGYEDMGADLHAAEAAAQAGRCHRRAGRGERARRLGVWASRLAGSTGGWAPDLVAPAADLTDREREIALLAAGGLSSPEIADRLTISPRTVDNHLGSVYGKLGIGGRDELPGVLAAGRDAPGRNS